MAAFPGVKMRQQGVWQGESRIFGDEWAFFQICFASSIASANWWRVGFGRVSPDTDLSFRRCGEAVVSVSLPPWCLGFGPGLNPFQEVPRRSPTSRRAAVVSSLAVSDAGFLDGAWRHSALLTRGVVYAQASEIRWCSSVFVSSSLRFKQQRAFLGTVHLLFWVFWAGSSLYMQLRPVTGCCFSLAFWFIL